MPNQIFVPKGNPSVLTLDEALDHFRARYVGDLIQRNDISRIRRQQEFIGAHQIWKLIANDEELLAQLIGGTSVSAEGPPGSSESPSAGGSQSPTHTPSNAPTTTPSAPTATSDPADQISGVCS
jgi:hypothetical protein